MSQITQKQLYEDTILFRSREHKYKEKWVRQLDILILWDEVWDSVHHFPMTNNTKTVICEQLHLDLYTEGINQMNYVLIVRKSLNISSI